jgi:Protein of unknown function (DUF3152)
VSRLVVATVLASLAFQPGPAHAGADEAGKFLFTASPRPSHEPPPRAPGHAGELRVVRVEGSGAAGLRVAVLVEGALPVSVKVLVQDIRRVLVDPRGWRGRGYAFQLVDEQADLEIVLASPALTDRLCAPLQTLGRYSCAQGGRAVLNFARWQRGAPAYRSLARYRIYMINHEVGHLLGRGHAYCSTAGALSPVMVQQTKGVAPCRPNPWPLSAE